MIKIIDKEINNEQLIKLAQNYYDDMIKGVVDIKRQILALGGEMHADAEDILLADGSNQKDLWGFNILLNTPVDECLVYESFINIRPRDKNTNLEVQDPLIREEMKKIIFNLVQI